MSAIFDYEGLKDIILNQKYTELRENIEDINAADVAEIIEDEELKPEQIVRIIRILPKSFAAEIFSHISIEKEQEIISFLTDKEAAFIIDNLYADDAADLVEEMPASIVKRILAATDPETRRDINHLLKYPEDSAGSIMTVEFVDFKASSTVAMAIQKLRKEAVDAETINTCYVLDSERRLLGTISLKSLVLNEDDVKLGDIMNENVITVNTMQDQEEVAQTFQKYDFTSMPVVDMEDRLVGIITIDDIVDILQEEATEDMEKMAAIMPSEKPYMSTSVFETWKARIPWLLILMISATFTGQIITHFEDALSSCVVLTAFIPMLMDTGGNAGGQASVSVIRAISLNELDFKDLFKVLWKEARVGVIVGISLAIANFAKIMLIDQVDLTVAIVVCLTVSVVVVIAKMVGCILPILAKKLGFDPAVMANPFITTIVDALSLLMYFGIASIFIKF